MGEKLLARSERQGMAIAHSFRGRAEGSKHQCKAQKGCSCLVAVPPRCHARHHEVGDGALEEAHAAALRPLW